MVHRYARRTLSMSPVFSVKPKLNLYEGLRPPRRGCSLWLAFQTTEVIDNLFEPFEGDLLIETCAGKCGLHDSRRISRNYDLVRIKNGFTDILFILPPPNIPQTWTNQALWTVKFMAGDTPCEFYKF